MPEKTTQKEHGKKTAPPSEKEVQPEVVIQIPLAELHSFPDHLFRVRDMTEIGLGLKNMGDRVGIYPSRPGPCRIFGNRTGESQHLFIFQNGGDLTRFSAMSSHQRMCEL